MILEFSRHPSVLAVILVLFAFSAAIMAIGLIRNESRKMAAEKALRESEANFRRSLDESPFGMYIVSEVGKTLYVNKAFLDLYGYATIAEFEQTPAAARYTAGSYRAHQDRKARRKRGEDVEPEYDIEIIRTDGGQRCVHVYRKQICWSGDLQSLAIYQDITDRVKMMSELRAAKEHAEESDRLKSAFLANMSHAIRTPLNVILGFSEMLASGQGPEQGTMQEYQTIIRRHSEDLLQTISNIVVISKLETGHLLVYKRAVNLRSLLESLRIRYARRLAEAGKEHIGLVVRIPENLPAIYTDKEKLSQIFCNLLDNAVRYTDEGSVTFGYRAVSDSRLQLFVSDTGSGIPKEFQPIVFDCFRAADHSGLRSSGGAGAGLSVVRRLTELLGGDVVLQSEPGKGTTVSFSLLLAGEREPVEEELCGLRRDPVV